jgi:hypothetical protein
MVVMEIVDAIAPLRGPTIAAKLRFAEGGRVGDIGAEHGTVKQDRQVGVIRPPAIL